MLLQNWKIGHSQFVWDIRQNKKVAKVFSKIWNVPSKDLLVSCQKDKVDGKSSVEIFDELMESLGDDDNFLVED